MSPVKQINAGLTSAMDCTRATRIAGFAGSVSLGLWKRVSPYATKRNGVFTFSRKSTVDVCALDFLLQPVSASNIATNSTNTVFERGVGREVIVEGAAELASIVPRP